MEVIKKGINICNELEEAIFDADIIIEAISENLEIKKKLFSAISNIAPKKAIIGTNSSSIPISLIESSYIRPEQCLNIHFAMILKGMNMVDIMAGTMTSAEVFNKAVEWLKSLNCIPLKVKKEIVGFCFNRVWRAVKKEVLYMWGNDFVDFQDIDRGWMIFNNTKIGPFGIMDKVGLDIVYDIEQFYFHTTKNESDKPPNKLKTK